MFELSDIEIEAVAGGMGFSQWVYVLNLAVEFVNGFIDGVNAATS